jgi:hypothetical protein
MCVELSMTLVLPYPLAIRASKLNHANTMAIILFIEIIKKSVAVKIVDVFQSKMRKNAQKLE